jgi:hypothetical protein
MTATATPTRSAVRNEPPFRADHVGSFLRPRALLDARERFARQEIDASALRAAEDAAIRDIVRFQEDLGLRGITDGEFRRTYFHIDFLTQLDGVETRGGIAISFHSNAGNVDFAPPVMHVTKKVRHARPIQRRDFEFLKSVTRRTPKVTIPSPTMLHFRGGRKAISEKAINHAVRALFKPDIIQMFEQMDAQAYMYVSGSGPWLVVYRPGMQIALEKLREFLLQAEVVVGAFRRAQTSSLGRAHRAFSSQANGAGREAVAPSRPGVAPPLRSSPGFHHSSGICSRPRFALPHGRSSGT